MYCERDGILGTLQTRIPQPAQSANICAFDTTGTGKTTTLVQLVIAQVALAEPDTWMLASAASNQGLDNLLEKLIDANIENLQILRVGNPNYCKNPKASFPAPLL